MNKKVVTGLVVFAAVLILVAIIGIFGLDFWKIEKSYSTKDISFKSNEAFLEKKLDGYDIYFENLSSDVIILGKYQTKSELKKIGYDDLTLEEYANIIFKQEEDTISELKQSDSKKYYYFTYDYKDGVDDIFYVGAMYENDDKFWLINFACGLKEQKEYEKKFLEWADTVKFKK